MKSKELSYNKMRIFCFFVFIITNCPQSKQQEEVIDYYEGEEGDSNPGCSHCEFYDNSDCSGSCNNANFKEKQPIKDIYGENVVQCCENHAYLFVNHCESNDGEETVCGSPDSKSPSLRLHSTPCPEHCMRVSLSQNEFTVDTDGKLNIGKFSEDFILQNDYCVHYGCENHTFGWTVKAETCVCLKPSLFSKANDNFAPELKRCCPQNLLTKVQGESSNPIQCPTDVEDRLLPDHRSEKPQNQFDCDSNFIQEVEVNSNTIELNNGNLKVIIPYTREEMVIADHLYCLGFTPSASGDIHNPLRTHIVYCKMPCKGKLPCLRTCCKPMEVFIDGSCKRMDESQRAKFFSLDKINGLNLNWEHIDSAGTNSGERKCKLQNFDRVPVLQPSRRCKDDFTIYANETNLSLEIILSGKKFSESEFCIDVTQDMDLQAEVCREKDNSFKHKFYPFILLLSSLCLFATLMVYIFLPKLLNHYTLIMRHFTFSMMLAFILLSINQFISFGNILAPLCIIFGFAEQYLFLVTFTFMTIMSVEIWMQITCKQTSVHRYLIQVVSGYLVPLVITFATLITEMTAPRCASYRPRFGEEQCFFSEKTAKGIWFFLPIGLMLLTNAFMFIMIIRAICKLEKERKSMGVVNKDQDDNMEKCLMFIKLFLGMGFIWAFEIIAGLAKDDIHESTWYVTDVVNMLQGVYIFIIFVCKKRVYMMILGKDRQTGTMNTRNTRPEKRISFRALAKKETQDEFGSITNTRTTMASNSTEG